MSCKILLYSFMQNNIKTVDKYNILQYNILSRCKVVTLYRKERAMSKNLEMSYLLDFYGNVLTDKQREMMQQYYNMDLSLSEIADNFGITRQGVRDSIKRGEGVLVQLEEQVGFAEKYHTLMGGLAKIKTCAQNIAFYNSVSYTTNDDIKKSADDIMKIIENIMEQEG